MKVRLASGLRRLHASSQVQGHPVNSCLTREEGGIWGLFLPSGITGNKRESIEKVLQKLRTEFMNKDS